MLQFRADKALTVLMQAIFTGSHSTTGSRWRAGLALLLALVSAGISAAATFGTVVSVGGHAADIALDEKRGLLYIANFTANQIDVMSLRTNTIERASGWNRG